MAALCDLMIGPAVRVTSLNRDLGGSSTAVDRAQRISGQSLVAVQDWGRNASYACRLGAWLTGGAKARILFEFVDERSSPAILDVEVLPPEKLNLSASQLPRRLRLCLPLGPQLPMHTCRLVTMSCVRSGVMVLRVGKQDARGQFYSQSCSRHWVRTPSLVGHLQTVRGKKEQRQRQCVRVALSECCECWTWTLCGRV